MKLLIFTTLFLFAVTFSSNAQVAINTSGASPAASAILDISSSDKGLLIPRLDTSSIASPDTGLLLFQPTDNQFYFYDGASWQSLGVEMDLLDADGDTGIVLDKTTDNDEVHIDISGKTRLKIEENPYGVVLLNFDNIDQNSNVFFGINAGLSTGADIINSNDGVGNVGIGDTSLLNNTKGSNNVAIGNNSLANNTVGDDNIAIGQDAIHKNVTGRNNISLGRSSLQNLTTGKYNIALGYNAGLYQDGLGDNVFIGREAGAGGFTIADLHSKHGNVMIGFGSGFLSQSNRSVFIGAGSGQNEQTDNRLYIENSNADSTNALIYGEFDNDLLRLNGRVIIKDGFTDGDGDTRIAFDQTNDDDVVRVQNNGTDIVSFSMNEHGSPMISNSIDFPYSTFLGQDAGALNRMDALAPLHGIKNTGIGNKTLSNNKTGSYNTALGSESMRDHVNGFSNTAIGNAALSNGISQLGNTAIGSSALINSNGDNTVSIGYISGYNDTLSFNNVFIGSFAGSGSPALGNSSFHSKSDNVMIGYKAGESNQGDRNIFIGNEAGKSIAGDDKLLIDNFDANATNALIYGDFDNDLLDFNAGVTITKNSETGSPQLNLNENNTGFSRLQFSNTSGKQITLAAAPSAITADSRLNFFIEDAGDIMTIRGNDRVGINASSPNQTLDVNAVSGDEPFSVSTGSTEHINVNSAGETTINNKLFVDGLLSVKDEYSFPLDYENFKVLKTSIAGSTYWGDEFWLRSGNEEDVYNLDQDIGIGISNPSHKLEVEENNQLSHVMKITNTNKSADADALAIQINTSAPISSHHYISFKTENGNNVAALRGNGAGGVALAQLSDKRHKQNIEPYSGALRLLANIDTYSYQMKSTPGITQIGFIAQELYKAFPQIVSGSPETTTYEDPMMVDYAGITPLLLAAIKELVLENDNLSKELKVSNQNLDKLSDRLSAIEAFLNSDE